MTDEELFPGGGRTEDRSTPDFTLDNQRVEDYLNEIGSRTIGGNMWPDTEIPIGESDHMLFEGKATGGVTDRPLREYQAWLFAEEFRRYSSQEADNLFLSEPSPQRYLAEAVRLQNPTPIFGGYNEAFSAGKTVLEIGSGEAVALLQLAQNPDFQHTSFIGLDKIYHGKRQVFPGKPGVQLTEGDWRSLETIPDSSIDTILSLQAIGMWGLTDGLGHLKEQDGNEIAAALTRVAKPGATLRMDIGTTGRTFLNTKMATHWDIDNSNPHVFIARKKQNASPTLPTATPQGPKI